MAPERFTKDQVEYLVAAQKFIKVLPSIPPRREGKYLLEIRSEVFRVSEPQKPISGLFIVGRIRMAPPGIPKALPSASLTWHGKRIRGVDKEAWHDNPDGSRVYGWHEHLWSPLFQDSYVIQARPEITRLTLMEIFTWGLEKWNIKVVTDQQGAL